SGVDDDPLLWRLHQERVDRHFQPTFLVGEMRNQPGQFPDFLVGRKRQDEAGAADRLQFDDFCDPDLAYSPVHPAFPLWALPCGEDAGFRVPPQWINPQHPALSESPDKELTMPELAISPEKVGFLIEK